MTTTNATPSDENGFTTTHRHATMSAIIATFVYTSAMLVVRHLLSPDADSIYQLMPTECSVVGIMHAAMPANTVLGLVPMFLGVYLLERVPRLRRVGVSAVLFALSQPLAALVYAFITRLPIDACIAALEAS